VVARSWAALGHEQFGQVTRLGAGVRGALTSTEIGREYGTPRSCRLVVREPSFHVPLYRAADVGAPGADRAYGAAVVVPS
jgi:hypothetical protein